MRYICRSSEFYPSDRRAVLFSPEYGQNFPGTDISICQGLYYTCDIFIPPDTNENDTLQMINIQLKNKIIETYIKKNDPDRFYSFYLRQIYPYFMENFIITIID